LSFVDDVRKQIESRLRELKPLVEEYQQLEKLASGWIEDARGVVEEARERVPGLGGSRGGTRRRATASTRKASTRSTGARKRGRPAGGTRAKASTASRKTGTRRATGARRGRRGGNTRANQALALVKTKPGITIPDIAKQMGIKQNYLYRVLPGLEAEGKVKRQDKGWAAK